MKIQCHEISVTRVIAIALLSFIGAMPGNAVAQPSPPSDYNEIQRKTFKKANEKFGIYSGVVVDVNRDGLIYDIRTKLINIGLTATDPAERAYQFFERHKDLFKIPDPRQELIVNNIVHGEKGAGVILFDQTVSGVKVYQGGCRVYFDSDSTGAQLNRVNCEYMGLLPDAHNIDPIPTIDSLEAGRIAQSDPAHGKNYTYVSYLGLWIANDYHYGLRPFPDKQTHLVWRLVVDGGAYKGSAEYFIDAHTGEILIVQPGATDCFGHGGK